MENDNEDGRIEILGVPVSLKLWHGTWVWSVRVGDVRPASETPNYVISSGGRRLDTREAAVENATAKLREILLAERTPASPSREQYEAACREQGVECYADEEINGRLSYALACGDFSMGHYTTADRVRMMLARRRASAIKAEQPPPPVAAVETPDAPPTARHTIQLWEDCSACGGNPCECFDSAPLTAGDEIYGGAQ